MSQTLKRTQPHERQAVIKHGSERIELRAEYPLVDGVTLMLPTVEDDSDSDITISGVSLSPNQRSVVFFVAGGTEGANHRLVVKANTSDVQTLVIVGDILIRGA